LSWPDAIAVPTSVLIWVMPPVIAAGSRQPKQPLDVRREARATETYPDAGNRRTANQTMAS
jgi:hypothetical protein